MSNDDNNSPANAKQEGAAEGVDNLASPGSAQVQQSDPENDAVPEKGESPWLERLISGTSTLLIVLVALVAYHFTIAQANKQRYAVVDIAEVLNIKELQVTITAMRPDASEEAKAQAFEEVAKFGKDVELVLNDLQQECGCSIFVKAAVVKPASAEDLTPELKRRLGMENINVNDLAQQLRRVGGQGTAPQLELNRK
jgi:hypothetical protein